MKTLLRVPELVEAVTPLVDASVSAADIFRLIGTGDIRPLGYVHRMPVFDLGQTSAIVVAIERSHEIGLP